MQIQSKYDIVIIGGGVYGLSIAYYLSKKQDIKIALLQQYAIGNNKGSSHSATRITRSLYEKEVYRDLNLECLRKNWPQLQKELGQKIVHQNQFIYYDDNKQSYENFKKVAEGSSSQKVIIFKSNQQYQKNYKNKKIPLVQSHFPPILDKDAGVIHASVYIKKIYQYLKTNCQNLTIIQHTVVKSLNQNSRQINIQTPSDILRANKVILSSGKWIGQLSPELSDMITPVKQYVAYLELQNMEKYKVGKFPCFVHNDKNGKLYYSVPVDSVDKVGVKLSQHKSVNINGQSQEKVLENAYEDLRKKALEYFGEDFVNVNLVDQCIYTNTKSGDFIIDWVGQSEKILVCSCCSGHGFKFAPILSEVISEIVFPEKQQSGSSKNINKSMQIFNKWQHMFKIPYHRGVNLQ